MDKKNHLFLFLILSPYLLGNALRCRVGDGPGNEELRNVVKRCVRRFTDSSDNDNSNNNNNYDRYEKSLNYRKNTDNHNYYSDDNNENNDNYDKNRSNLPNSQRNQRNNNRNKNSNSNNNQQNQSQIRFNSNGNSGMGFLIRNRRSGNENDLSNHQKQQMQQQQQQQQQQLNERRHNAFRSGQQQQRNYGNQSENYSQETVFNRNQRQGSSQYDNSCVVHCFFEELNMLREDDYPDRHKVLHILTRDVRDRELKEFYVDTIQECFRFVEMEQARNKCQFSNMLINCMLEYARANCEDWNNHTITFT